jgi:hypothetical protein
MATAACRHASYLEKQRKSVETDMRAISASLIVILTSLLIFQITSAVLRQHSTSQDVASYVVPSGRDPLAADKVNDPM